MSYVFAYDTTEQKAIAGTLKDITFDTNVLISGWTHLAGSAEFRADVTNIYRITYVGRGDISNNILGLSAVGIRALRNGIVINGSEAGLDIINEHYGESFEIVQTFLVPLNAGDVLKLQLYGSTHYFKLSRNEGILNSPSITLTIDSI